MKIKFNPEQLQKAVDTAIARHEAKNISFRNKSIYFPQKKNEFGIPNEYAPHLIGVLGEMAWATVKGVPIDEKIYKVRDKGEDFRGVEIKTVTYFGRGEPELKVKVKEFHKKHPQVYVLMRVDPNTLEVELLGKISRKKFDDLKKVKRYGAKLPDNYIVPLSLMDEIKLKNPKNLENLDN
jgi:hypothetical protein